MAIPAVSPWINKQKVLKTLCVLIANSMVELTGPSGWSSCLNLSSSAHFLASFVLFSLLNPAEMKIIFFSHLNCQTSVIYYYSNVPVNILSQTTYIRDYFLISFCSPFSNGNINVQNVCVVSV